VKPVRIILAIAGIVGPAAATDGQITEWSASPGVQEDWFTPSNWTNGVPDIGTSARINNGGIAGIAGTAAEARVLFLGLDGGSGSLHVVNADLVLDFAGFLGWGRFGLESRGSITASNATVNGGFDTGLVHGSGVGIGSLELVDSELTTSGIGVGITSVSGVGGQTGFSASSFLFDDISAPITSEGASGFNLIAGSTTVNGPASTGTSSGTVSIAASQVNGINSLIAGAATATQSGDLAEASANILIDAASVSFAGSAPGMTIGAALPGEDATSRVEAANLTLRNAVVTGVNLLGVGIVSALGANANGFADGSLTLESSSLEAVGGNIGSMENGPGVDPMIAACGRIDLTDSTLQFSDSAIVGKHTDFSSGIGTPSGTVSLTRSTLVVSNDLTVGSDSTLVFDIGGTARGTAYGTVDAGTALLEGDIEVQFTYAPQPGDFFDLVVTASPTGMLDGIPPFSFSGGGVSELAGGIGLNSESNQVFRVGLIPRPEIVEFGLSNDLICITISNLLAQNSYRIEQASNVSSNLWVELGAFVASGIETAWYGSATGSIEQAGIRISTP